MLTEYTTYAEVRAALGVSEEEIDDTTLELQMYESLLEEDLDAVSPAVRTTWLALPEDESLRSADEVKFAQRLRLYSTYSVAAELLTSVELFGYLKVADGRASTERRPQAFDTIKANVQAMKLKARAWLLASLELLVPGTPVTPAGTINWTSSVAPATDPVTGT